MRLVENKWLSGRSAQYRANSRFELEFFPLTESTQAGAEEAQKQQ